MWHPDINLDIWFKINPFLKSTYPLVCKCGRVLKDVKPYVTKQWIGIIGEHCLCGTVATSVGMPRNKQFTQQVKQTINTLMA